MPSVAEDAAYQQWADGLAQRAEQVTDPNLADTAVQVADLASQFVAKFPRCAPRYKRELLAPRLRRWCTRCRPSIMRITEGFDELAKACNS